MGQNGIEMATVGQNRRPVGSSFPTNKIAGTATSAIAKAFAGLGILEMAC
jgi:hypothetical protein